MNNTNKNKVDENGFLSELYKKYPLARELVFSRSDIPGEELLPAFIPMLACITDPEIEGDCCAVLPSVERVAAYVATLVALSEVVRDFDQRLAEYATTGFEQGDRVRVLPTDYVFEFGGVFEGHDFFKLNVIDSSSGETRSFPMQEIVRLEKTERSRPKGRGGSKLGEAELSELDYLVGTTTYGNDALLGNEIILVSTQVHFRDFMDNVLIARVDNPEVKLSVRDVIPWGVVTPDGNIDFRDSYATGGSPLIAVSSRIDYAATACRKGDLDAARVIIDGASRIGDSYQALDDLVEKSKLLILSSHVDSGRLSDISDRDCDIWTFPNNQKHLVGKGPLLPEFRRSYLNAANFKLRLIHCDSELIDKVAATLLKADKLLSDGEADEDHKKLLSIYFSRLLELSSCVASDDVHFEALRERINQLERETSDRKRWMDPDLVKVFESALKDLQGATLSANLSKGEALLECIESIQGKNRNVLVLTDKASSAAGTRDMLNGLVDDIRVEVVDKLEVQDANTDVILTGWPKAQKMNRVISTYATRNVYALAYGFEQRWFEKTRKAKVRQISRWLSDGNKFEKLTGITSPSGLEKWQSDEPEQDFAELNQLIKLEHNLGQIRKGPTPTAGAEENREARYFGFVGTGYTYLTPGHKVPDVTEIVAGGTSDKSVVIKTTDKLRVGDYVLFRERSDRDIIRYVAELMTGSTEYARVREQANLWKDAVKSGGLTPIQLFNTLERHGLQKGEATVKNWITDDDMIGPGQRDDLDMIYKATNYAPLGVARDKVWGAILAIRGSHTAAGAKISQILATQLPEQFEGVSGGETSVDLDLDDKAIGTAIILQIENIAENVEFVPGSWVNYLQRE
jgi:hypothetical protein